MHDDSKPSRNVPLLDLRAQFASIEAEIWPVIQHVVTSQKFILGEEVAAFEKEVAEYCACTYAIGCASGSDALLLALMAYNIGPGDRVLTTPYTFFATAAAISRLGATPVFVDIEPDHFNLNPDHAVEAIRSRSINAVIPVHLFGACTDLDPILAAARERDIPVIEDAAQSIGSEYKGRRAGSIGGIGCFSFFPSKNLGAFGDAGLCTTNDPSIAEQLRSLRVHGSRVKYYHESIGINSRLDALQAAVLRVKLLYLDTWSDARQRNAELYRELLQSSVILPEPPPIRHAIFITSLSFSANGVTNCALICSRMVWVLKSITRCLFTCNHAFLILVISRETFRSARKWLKRPSPYQYIRSWSAKTLNTLQG